MKKLKLALAMSVVIGLLCILPAAFNQAGAAQISADSVLIATRGGNSHGSSSGSNTSLDSDKHSTSQNQTQTTERVDTSPDKLDGQKASQIMENTRGALKQIREQSGNQAIGEEKWQELRGEISQIKEQRKLRQVTREEAKAMVRECLDLATKQQNLEEQEQLLEDLVEIDPADTEAYKELGAAYRMQGKQGVKVFSNGVGIKFDVPPVIKEGRTLIPVRALTEGLGATVTYDAENKTVTVTKGETTIVLTLGQNVALVNGQEVTLDAKAELNNNRTVVPLRFIAETFKLNVDNPDEDIVTVNDPPTDTTTGSDTGTTTGSTTENTTPEGTTEETTTENNTGSTTGSSTETNSATTTEGVTTEESTTQNAGTN